jgi:hypothetical protein
MNITEKLLSPTKLAIQIEKIVQKNKMNYIDAIIYFSECSGYDLMDLVPLLNSAIKYKIRLDAEALHLISGSSKLPI